MPTIQRSDGSPTWKIEYDVNGFENSQLWQRFIKAVYALNAVEPLALLSVDRDDLDPTHHTYKFVTVDDRTWVQEFIREGSHFNYAIKALEPGFHEGVIEAHIVVRQLVGEIIVTHQPSKIKIQWP